MDNCAILIGVSHYIQEFTGLEPLCGVKNSVIMMRDTFIRNCSCEERNVFVFPQSLCEDKEESNYDVSGQDILRFVNDVSKSRTIQYEKVETFDNLYLYCIGHGITDLNGNACLVPSDSVIVGEEKGVSFGALQITTLLNMVRLCFRNRYKHLIVFIDSCRRPLSQEWDEHILRPEHLPTDTIVYFSTLPYQNAGADKETGGIFTNALIEVLKSELGIQTADKLNRDLRRIMRIYYPKQVPLMQTSCADPQIVSVSTGGYAVSPLPTEAERNEVLNTYDTNIKSIDYGDPCIEEFHHVEDEIKRIIYSVYKNILRKFYQSSSLRRLSLILRMPGLLLKVIPGVDRFQIRMRQSKLELENINSQLLIESKKLEGCIIKAKTLLRSIRVHVHIGVDLTREGNIHEYDSLFPKLSELHKTASELEATIAVIKDFRHSMYKFAGDILETTERIVQVYQTSAYSQIPTQKIRTEINNWLISTRTQNRKFYLNQRQKHFSEDRTHNDSETD